MGRAMIIICAGVLVSLGIISMSTADQGKLLTQKTSKYANEISAKNAAHTAIQIAMQKINKDSTWANNLDDTGNPWITNIDGAEIKLYLTFLNEDHEENSYWKEDKLRLVSNAKLAGDFTASVTSVYLKSPFSTLVPPFQGGLTSLSDNINVHNIQGSASLSGTAPTGSGCEEDKPAITVTTKEDSISYANATSDADIDGSENINVDPDLTYQPTDKLIERLSNTTDAKVLPEGKYDGFLGTKDNPGVFFVNNSTRLAGQTEGYGIMVVRTSGSLDYEGELDLKGTFDFHGLVIFENAYALDAKGTPTIHGSMLIGNTEEYDGPALDIDIGGNVGVQYDCRGETYAKKAAAQAVQQNKYTRVVTYE